jgi:hypothetical protein
MFLNERPGIIINPVAYSLGIVRFVFVSDESLKLLQIPTKIENPRKSL